MTGPPHSATAAASSKGSSITPGTLASIISPALVTTLILIFGGCCSNVYTLEAILSFSPATGQLITFLQFVLITLYKLPSQLQAFSTDHGDLKSENNGVLWFKKNKIPLKKWIIFAVQFVAINVLNNAAFKYKISLPLHIILRSAGPVTSMMLGYAIASKRYSPRKILAVILLFVGVVLAALSDANSRADGSNVTTKSEGPVKSKIAEQVPGFVLVTLALLLSAIMGIYSDALYSTYGRSAEIADEQLFYGHALSLPFFALQHHKLKEEYSTLLMNANVAAANLSMASYFNGIAQYVPESAFKLFLSISSVPVLLLAANAITQVLCISGVHHLSTQTSSLTVSIVLNIRKLVSLLLSIWLFGNRLPFGVALGAVIVFVGGGLYGIPEKKQATIDVKVSESKKKNEIKSGIVKEDIRGSKNDELLVNTAANGTTEKEINGHLKSKQSNDKIEDREPCI